MNAYAMVDRDGKNVFPNKSYRWMVDDVMHHSGSNMLSCSLLIEINCQGEYDSLFLAHASRLIRT